MTNLCKQCGQVREDTKDMVSFSCKGLGVFLFHEFRFCAINAAPF